MGKYFDDENKEIDFADLDCKSGNCTAKCNTAYVNASLLCGQCAHDYSHDGLTGRCDHCPPADENIVVAIAGGLIGIVCLFVYIFITLSDGGHLDESDGAKSIGLSFIQLISLLATFPIAWCVVVVVVKHYERSLVGFFVNVFLTFLFFPPQATHLRLDLQSWRCHYRSRATFNQFEMHVSRHVRRRCLFSHSIALGCGTTDFNNPVCRNVAIDEQM